jgi:cysteine desulfurase
LRDRLERRLTAEMPGARIFGAEAARLPNTSCFALPEQSAERLVIALDLMGIAVSAGAACSSGKVAPSHVLAAMGVAPGRAGAAIRVSLGQQSTVADVERLLAAIDELRGESGAAAAAEVAVSP